MKETKRSRIEDEIVGEMGARPDVFDPPGGPGPLRLLRAGEAGGEQVVLLHGRGHAAAAWFPCWPALAGRGAVLAVDLPGFGGSAAAPPPRRRAGAEGGLGFFVEPVEALLQAEARARGAAAFTLVGHSLGGLVALELALRGRVAVSRLVLIDGMGLGPAMTGASRLFFRLHPERLARLLGARLFQRLNPPPPTALGGRVAALEHELLTAGGAAARARRAAARAFDLLCPLRGPAFHRGDRLGALRAPVLLVWGERDAALPLSNAEAARAALPSAELLRLPLGHSPHLEAPEQVLPALLRFVAGGR